jgi:putative membrane protein insertion efficiency factor
MGTHFAGPPRGDKSVCATPERSAPVTTALFALRFYKAYLSMLFAGSCRFEPTCSQYSYEAIERFGLARGTWLTLKRLARCQPFSRRFGCDPVPEDGPVPENWEEYRPEPAQIVGHPAAASHEVPK